MQTANILSAGGLLIIISVDNPLDLEGPAILPVTGVAAEPHPDLGGLHHLARVVPGHAVPGTQDKPRQNTG